MLSRDTRLAIAAVLAPCLADLLDLRSQIKEAHWTVKGPHFIEYHKLFDELASRLGDHTDELAERISTLGMQPMGTIRDTARTSRLPEFPIGVIEGSALIGKMTKRYEQACENLRRALAGLEEDPVSLDLATGMLRKLELDLWFLDSHQPVS